MDHRIVSQIGRSPSPKCRQSSHNPSGRLRETRQRLWMRSLLFIQSSIHCRFDNEAVSPGERSRLLKLGAELNHQVDDLMEIVSVKTCRRWVRELEADGSPLRVGRLKRMTASLRKLILRLARKNVGWGVRRIVGELRKFGLTPSRSSIQRLLVSEGLLPDPGC